MARQALGKGLDSLIPGAKKFRGTQKGAEEINITGNKHNRNKTKSVSAQKNFYFRRA